MRYSGFEKMTVILTIIFNVGLIEKEFIVGSMSSGLSWESFTHELLFHPADTEPSDEYLH